MTPKAKRAGRKARTWKAWACPLSMGVAEWPLVFSSKTMLNCRGAPGHHAIRVLVTEVLPARRRKP
jgi:hypothetical protein